MSAMIGMIRGKTQVATVSWHDDLLRDLPVLVRNPLQQFGVACQRPLEASEVAAYSLLELGGRR